MAKQTNGKKMELLNGQFQQPNGNNGTLAHKASEPITEREQQILQYFAYGFTTPELSKEIFISEHTIETHRKSIIRKMGVRNLTHAIAEAMRKKLIR